MKSKGNTKLNLTPCERKNLRSHKVKVSDILYFSVDELEVLLDASTERAREIHALANFQSIHSIGIRFAKELIFLGYYAIEELKEKDPALLTEEYERKKGYWIDSCVEDQFRLVTHVADTGDLSKNWWDFTKERKEYRSQKGYPSDRPKISWYEVTQV
ncbi:MAG: helix-hairpin-helix domain-containing protein [Bacteroidota bacterium]